MGQKMLRTIALEEDCHNLYCGLYISQLVVRSSCHALQWPCGGTNRYQVPVTGLNLCRSCFFGSSVCGLVYRNIFTFAGYTAQFVPYVTEGVDRESEVTYVPQEVRLALLATVLCFRAKGFEFREVHLCWVILKFTLELASEHRKHTVSPLQRLI
jgi:hypothetical protein